MILHVDMDAFFASVEQSSNPKLQNRPIAVAGSAKRSVIVTSSYEARRFGVKTGMTVPEAKRLCPELTIVVANFEKYASTSKKIMEIFKKYGTTEVFSVDEAFIDIGERAPYEIAKNIKEEIWRSFKITCSIGVGINKTIAKLASGIHKPDGYFYVHSFDQIKDLPIKEACGVGDRSFKKLQLIGINTIGDFVNTRDSIIKAIMNIQGIRLKLALEGKILEQVNPIPPLPRSLGNSMTLPRDIWDKVEVEKAIFQLSEKVGFRLRRYNLWGKRISLYARYKDFESFCLEKKFYSPTNDELEIYRRAVELLQEMRLLKPIRLLGVTISELTPATQLSIFDDNKKRRIKAIDEIREKWGYGAITWGLLVEKFNHNPPISPAWRPERC